MKKIINKNNGISVLDTILAEKKELERRITELERVVSKQGLQIKAIQLVLKRLLKSRQEQEYEQEDEI